MRILGILLLALVLVATVVIGRAEAPLVTQYGCPQGYYVAQTSNGDYVCVKDED